MRVVGFYSKGRGGKRKRNLRPLLLLLIVIGAFAAGMLVHRIFDRPIQEDANISYIGDLPVHEDFLAEGSKTRPGQKREIKYLVIHETDNFSAGANSSAHNAILHNITNDEELSSWHYTVDDKEVYHHLPDDENAFHAGDGMEKNSGNMNGIGIEMCVNEDGDYEKTLKNTEKLCARLLLEYDLKPKALRKHEDFSGKVCPAKLIGANRWDEFCDAVEDQWKQMKKEEAEKQK